MTQLTLLIQALNMVLSSSMFRSFILVITSVYTGYTLYPVPKFLDEMFYTSNIFKYIILLFLLCTSMYPVTNDNILIILIIPIIVLIFFKFLRKYDNTRSLTKIFNGLF